MLSFNNWITYNPTSTSEEEGKVHNKGSNNKSNIAKIDDDNKNPIKLLPIVGKCIIQYLLKEIHEYLLNGFHIHYMPFLNTLKLMRTS